MKKTILIIVLLISVQIISATTYLVPTQFSTIQGAVDSVSTGDVIVVLDGTYYENITINTLNLTIKSLFGPEDCIIDGGTHCITVNVATERIEGFTFTDASNTALYVGTNQLSELSNCIFEDNERSGSYGGSAIMSSIPFDEISDCIFTENDGPFTVYIFRDNLSGTFNELFKNNIFIDNTNDGTMADSGRDICLYNSSLNYTGGFESNTFKGSSGGIFFWALYGDVDITNCAFDEAEIDDDIGDQEDITINYSCFSESEFYGYNWGSGNLTSTDPELNSTTCQPLWNSSVKSPCIDVGDPSLSDDNDGTPPDIGAVSAVSHRIDEVELPDTSTNNGWKWMSFPALDNVLDDADVAENVLDDVLNVSILDTLYSEIYEIYWTGSAWSHDYEQFSRTEGFKFLMLDDITFDIPGFKENDYTTIALTGNDEENWIGYWLEDTQDVSDAFEDYWDGSNVYSIQHQLWSATYFGGQWWGTAKEPTLSYGDMFIVKCDTTISDFEWNNGAPTTKTVFPDPEYFSYSEQADYIPVYVEIDENNLPQEIGVFVNDVCIGARVVEDTITQINAYTTSAPLGEVELELYYGRRSENKRLSKYNCLTSSNPNAILNQLSTENNDNFWYVDLREGSSVVQTPEKVRLNNYPNPFNPSTTISYSVPNDGFIELSVYNIKGQLVKTLVNEDHSSGSYQAVWNGKDNSNKNVSTGIYFYKLSTNGQTLTKKMLLLE